jgi:membrane peptidoglycan carboxypeptidase
VPPKEKLQRGRTPKRRGAAPAADGWFGQRLYASWQARHARKKKRLAAMSRRRRVARRFGIIGTWFLGILALFMVTTVVLFYSLSDVPRPETLPLPQVVTITYADGSAMARLGSENRTIVNLKQVPESVRWAVLAAEDRGFYSEPGVSIKGTIRAALSDVTGGDTQGGSGITQQYAKNAYLSDSRTLSRKLKELMIAVKLSREYSKDQILEFYLNTVYFGRGAYGIQAAAQTFFNHDVSKLSVAQGAVLAAQLRAPSYYDPAVNPDLAHQRWQYVIDGMRSIGRLTAAQEQDLKYPPVAPVRNNGLGATGPTQLIVQRVLAELQAHGISEDEASARGMTVRTTIDRNAQTAATQAIDTVFANLTPQQRNLKNALVAVDPTSGGVLAYYGGPGPGGKNYAGKPDEYDYAGSGGRPPGSSFKPYTLATVLTQTLHRTSGKKQLTIDSHYNGSYCVKVTGLQICNDPGDQSVSGPSVKIADAMKFSLNTTFDLLAQDAGPNNVASIAHAMGIATTNSRGTPTLKDSDGNTSFGIGIGDYPVTPLDQANGFATLADNGMKHDPYFVQKVTASSGSVVYEHKNSGTRALDSRIANDVTLTLEPIAAWSNDPLSGGRVSGAKTGTEGIPGGTQNSDAWMVGFTPQVSAAVWVGSGNSVTPIYNAYGASEYGSDLAGKTWKVFMDTYLAGKPNLPMATKQMITGGINVTPSPSKSKSPSKSPSSSTSTSTSGAPSTSADASPTTTPPTSPPPTSPTPSVTCTGILGTKCTTSPAPPPPGG